MSYDVSAFYVTETHLKNRLKTDVKPGGGILSGGNGPGYQTNDINPSPVPTLSNPNPKKFDKSGTHFAQTTEGF